MIVNSPSDPTNAALEAALRYAKDKCMNLVNSASTLNVDTSSEKSLTPAVTPTSTPAKLLATSAVSPLFLPPQSTTPSTTGPDSLDGPDDTQFDEATDFGIDQGIAQAALAALGADAGSLTRAVKANGGTGKRHKKELSEMDQDERLLASVEAKKLTSRQRRQIRNRVSARQFRLRRKEYISHLESLVINMTTKINRLEQSFKNSEIENKRLTLELENSKKHLQVPQVSQMPQRQYFQGQPSPNESTFITDLTQQRLQSQIQQYQLQQLQQLQELQKLARYSNSNLAPSSSLEMPSPEDLSGSKVFPSSYSDNPFLDSPSIGLIDHYSQIAVTPALSPSSSTSSRSGPSNNNRASVSSNSAKSPASQTTFAEVLRMKPNVVNLLPTCPNLSPSVETSRDNIPLPTNDSQMFSGEDNTNLLTTDTFDWQQAQYDDFVRKISVDFDELSNVSNSGYIQIPNTQIYHSIIPELCRQFKDDQKSAVMAATKDRKLKGRMKNEEEESRLKLSKFTADAVFSRLDFQMSQLNIVV